MYVFFFFNRIFGHSYSFKTKSPFMQRVVDKQEFARHEKLLRMLQRTEQAYKRLLYVIPERM